jgi:uncharacterized membrane protein
MTHSFTMSADAAAYLEALRGALADLPADERDGLLVDVEASLIESGDDEPVATRLGPPARFAAELRSAAGLRGPEPLATPPAASEPAAVAALLAWVRRLAADRRLGALRGTLAELAPIWWLARAYAAAGALALLSVFGAAWSARHPVVPRLGSSAVGVVVLAGVVGLSIALGLRTRRNRPRTGAARAGLALLNAALLAAAVAVVVHVARPEPVRAIGSAITSPSLPGLTNFEVPVQNIYAYSRTGRLLHDVLLYDEFGRPLDIRPHVTDPFRRVLVSASGVHLFNSYPIRYFDPSTGRVAHPDAGPTVHVPRVATPALPGS